MVAPDLDETRKRVRVASIVSATVMMREGRVESRTIRSGNPSRPAKHWRMTSGPRLLPPMPSKTTCSMPSSRTSSANAVRSSTSPSIEEATSSQPRRSAISVGSSDQRVWSLDQIRATASDSCREATASSAVARTFPSDTPAGAALVARSRSLLADMFSISSSKESANAFTPSCISWVVTASMLIPADSRDRSVSRAS